MVPEDSRCQRESVLLGFIARAVRKQARLLHILVHLVTSVPWEVRMKYLASMVVTRMSSSKEYVRHASKVTTVMEPFLMRLTAVMVFSSPHRASRVTIVQVEPDLHGNTSVPQVGAMVMTYSDA